MKNFNKYQYEDFLNRGADLYARAKYQIVLTYLARKTGLRILNVGCGSGELSFLLADAGHTVIGIDPCEEYIALAESHMPESLRTRCFFIVNSVEKFSSVEKFDCIIATDVLEHIADDRVAVQKLADLLIEGGDIIITVPALPLLFGYHDELLGHFRRYSKKSLCCLMLGIKSITLKKIRYFGFTLSPVCYLYSKLLRKPYLVAHLGKGFFPLVRRLILRIMLTFDQFIPMPFGTSLIFWGTKSNQ